ncbi:zinc finger BED domain-containing protein 4-like [Manduca sexta]|uniref:zinc finger BED domain-containing protein 4-like n=1 Tax=Manduca sexta TaxID=7130 RepID=UPI00188E51DB|nr:zinc finger BED domain-containing protein 4-like [Manduca sexta]
MWTSPNNQGICAITAHFILKQRLHCALLAAVVVEGHHNADNIASVLDGVLQEWRCRNKVVALVTDNAATMIKVADILKIRHVPCFAHSLNLVIKEVLAEPGLKQLIEKCSMIVSHFKHSTLASDKLRSVQREINRPELKLVKFVETRWNSAFYMLKRILEVRQELTLVLGELPNAPENLTANEYSIVEELGNILEPLETCTVGISGEDYVTISLIIPLIKGLCLQMVELENQHNSDFAKTVIAAMKTSVQKRLKCYETRSPCMIATLLNPHFKRAGFKTHTDAENAILITKKEYATYLSSERFQISLDRNMPEVCEEVISPPSPKKSKLRRLLSFVDNAPKGATSVTADIIVDMRQYLEKPTIPFSEYPVEYWYHQENKLKHIAMKFLCIPGSSTPAERVFRKLVL